MNRRPPFRKKPDNEPVPGGPDDALSGQVERVTFHNEETGFCILKVKVQGRKEPVAVLGSLPSVAPGEWITAQGTWEKDRDHGIQLKAHTLKTQPPTSLEGIEKYLGSGMIKGIGPVYATKLVKKFGDKVFDIIENQSKRLQEVDGIGRERRQRIKDAWAEQKVVRDIMLFLHAHGLGTNRAVRIYKSYGVEAIELIRADPYRLARDIHGIGFHSADGVAEKLGLQADSLLRARAALEHLLDQATTEGHCALPRRELLEVATRLLEVDEEIVAQAFERHLKDERIISEKIEGEEMIFMPLLRDAEERIARQLRRLSEAKEPEPPIDVEKAIPWVEEKTGRKLSPSQHEALKIALRSRAVVITGGPGVGKTTLVQSLLKILTAKKLKCILAAPTGRASQRMAEATGLEASTLHRLLEFQPARGGFQRNASNPLEGDVVVIDEVSMVDVPLMSRLLDALPRKARLILVGDADQLPSVGPGLVLGDIIRSGMIPVVHLKEIFRQAGDSRIISGAHSINRGEIPDIIEAPKDSDFIFIDREDPEECAATLVSMVRDRLPKHLGVDPIEGIQILSPMHRGSLGIKELNLRLQAALNAKSEYRDEYQAYGNLFRVGDKVIQTSNNYDKEVFNGDIGRIRSMDREEKQVLVRFGTREVIYEFNELDELELAYAITIHKSQGSEFPVVVIPLAMQQYLLLQRNLLYTGVTRGKRMVVLVGQKKALGMAVRNESTRHRHGGLLYRLARN
ncbi:MAG: ATP-dependent RecD-like DNA helicase [Chthoniobacterales bacterium]|nr:ATP-dependent RecD-like DNA helicase [Chthoniobacterales bacterium]